MIVKAIEVTLHLHEAHSLKDKRQVLQSLLDPVRRRFNVSIAEVDSQDVHRRIVLGIACVSNSERHAVQSLDAVVRYIESRADADIVAIDHW